MMLYGMFLILSVFLFVSLSQILYFTAYKCTEQVSIEVDLLLQGA